MTVELRIALAGLAAFAVVGLICTILVPFIAPRSTKGSAARRASRLSQLRLMPSIAAGLSAMLVSGAFLVFEPRWDGEEFGVVVQLLAGLTVLLLAAAAWRGIALAMLTRRLANDWLRTAEPVWLPGISAPAYAITTDFPTVAVVGIAKPRLIIARSVLASCSGDELRAVLAHEQGHIDRRDNLRRLLISMAPDVLAWLPASARLTAAWHDAAEQAADDEAANAGVDGRLRLASALVKVARLAPSAPHPALIPASALYRGEDLNRRVRRLLESGGDPDTTARGSRILAVAGVLLAAGSVVMLESVHDIVEGLIHTLP